MEGQTNKQRKVFSGLIFTTAQVVPISARITFIHVFIRSITRGHGFKSRTGLNFFRPYFHYCSCSAHHCEDHFHLRKENLFWPNQHSKNNIYLRVAVSFNIHLKVLRLKVRQTGEQDLTTNFKRKLFMSEVQPIKVKKKGNNFFVWNVIYAIYLDAFISNTTTL